MSVIRNSISNLTIVFLLVWSVTAVAMAQAADDAVIERRVATAPTADDLAMERKVRGLATDIGNAYVCTDEKERAQFEQQSWHLFDLILQDVGSDLAYIYAISIGSGSTRSKKSLDCPKLLNQWKKIRKDYELKGDK